MDTNDVHSNTHENNTGISPEDIARAIKSIAYRKAYNQRPEVQAKRKEYNRTRAERIKIAMEYIKKHPEVVA
jgi:hypothetical protein